MRLFLVAAALCASLAISGCASIDESLFGTAAPAAEPSTKPAPEAPEEAQDQSSAPAAPLAGETGAAPASPPASEEEAGAMPGTLPATEPGGPSEAAGEPVEAPAEAATAPAETDEGSETPAPAARAVATARSPGVGAVTILPGADTGTAVSHTIAGIRGSLQDAATRTIGAGQQYATLRGSSAQQLGAYYQAQAQISAKLQIGTTRGNPELVAQWNAAQGALDQLTANINALNTLVAQIGGEASRVRGAVAQIQQTLDMSGAVDEDHRQLTVLEDEANQIVVVLDRLARDASADLRRQTATLSNERSRLAQLASSIKAGDLYATDAPAPRAAAAMSASSPAAPVAGAPIVTIKFARASTNYQKPLYAALSRALQSQPSASFNVVGVSPPRGTAAAVQSAQNDARRHAQQVMSTMTEMGVPAARMEISSATDPSIRTSEVRVFLR
jgi:hypothetical protein